MATVDLTARGHQEAVTVSAATKTLTSLTDSGLVQNVTVSSTITLPATAAGNVFPIRIGKEGITVSISPAAADYIAGAGLTNVDNKDLVFTNQPAGSYVVLGADGTNGYFVESYLGTPTKEA